MGFWSGLLKIGGAIGGAVAAPFTGGTSLAWLPGALSAGGQVLGGMADASASNRGAQTDALFNRDALALRAQEGHENALQNRADLELRQKQDARTALQQAYQQALRSALARNATDVSVNRPEGVPMIRFSGSPRPSQLGPQGREAAEIMNNKALQALLSGESYTPLPALQRFQPSALPKAGFMENVLGPLGLGLSAAGAIANIRKQAGVDPGLPEDMQE